MKKTKTPPTQDLRNSEFLIPLSIEGVNQRIGEFIGNDTAKPTSGNFQIDAAKRNAWLDLSEAKAKAALKMTGSDAGPSRKALMDQLEEIEAMRMLGKIFDDIARAAGELDTVVSQASPHRARLQELQSNSDALTRKLADWEARDIRKEMETYNNLEDEARWTRAVLETGRWRSRGGDAGTEILAQELGDLQSAGKYNGEISFDGAVARIAAIDAELTRIDEKSTNQLTEAEMCEMPNLPRQIDALAAEILEETRYSHFVRAAADVQKKRFGELIEASKIAAESVVEVFLFNRETLAAAS